MKITFVGGGNMAQAMIGGLLKNKTVHADDISVVDPELHARQKIEQMGVHQAYVSLNALPPPPGDVIVLAVKPQSAPAACQLLAPALKDQVVLSIAAGVRLKTIARNLNGHSRLVRCMPNTPALIGAGVTAAYAQSHVTEAQRGFVDQILGSIGKIIWVDEEAMLDPVTAVSGSGPAYVFYFIEALEQAAIDLGLSAEAARTLALETFVGAAKLAASSSDSPSVLREKVTSKGGTTERALASLSDAQVKDAIIKAVKAANQRAIELGDVMDIV